MYIIYIHVQGQFCVCVCVCRERERERDLRDHTLLVNLQLQVLYLVG